MDLRGVYIVPLADNVMESKNFTKSEYNGWALSKYGNDVEIEMDNVFETKDGVVVLERRGYLTVKKYIDDGQVLLAKNLPIETFEWREREVLSKHKAECQPTLFG
jgi:hypothetical protein